VNVKQELVSRVSDFSIKCCPGESVLQSICKVEDQVVPFFASRFETEKKEKLVVPPEKTLNVHSAAMKNEEGFESIQNLKDCTGPGKTCDNFK
jgi:hypothetical protein